MKVYVDRRQVLRRMLLILMVFTVIWAGGVHPTQACDSLDIFVASPAPATWAALRAAVASDRCGQESALLATVMRYHDHLSDLGRLTREQTPTGIAYEEHYSTQVGLMEVGMEYIRQHSTLSFWRLAQAMAAQGFDQTLAKSGLELAARASNCIFEEIATRIETRYPGKAPMIKEARDEWEPYRYSGPDEARYLRGEEEPIRPPCPPSGLDMPLPRQ